jgi:hypothetical protein
MNIMRESLVLAAIGIADLTSTLIFVGNNYAAEGNPLMAYYLLRYGVGVFVFVKLALIFLPVFIAEWSRAYKPTFARFMMRGAIVAYLTSYLLVFVFANFIPRPISRVESMNPPQQIIVNISK